MMSLITLGPEDVAIIGKPPFISYFRAHYNNNERSVWTDSPIPFESDFFDRVKKRAYYLWLSTGISDEIANYYQALELVREEERNKRIRIRKSAKRKSENFENQNKFENNNENLFVESY